MKKFYVLALSGLLLAACSDDLTDIDNNESSADDARYMSISLVANNTSTRAGEGEEENNNAVASTTPDYKNGTSDENAIYNVVFYFFDKDGNPFNVNKDVTTGEAVNFRTPVDLNGVQGNGTDGNNVALTKAVVVIEPEVKGTIPAQVVAVVNYNFTLKALSLGDLRKQELSSGTLDVTTTNGDQQTTTTYYTMSNSVYVKSAPTATEELVTSTPTTTGTIMYATPISASNFTSVQPDVTSSNSSNAVQIYVERVLGKVSTSFLLSGKTEATTPDATATTNLPSFSVDEGGKAYNVTTWANNQFGSAEVSLSAQIVGWNYYNQSIKTTLEKSIDTYTGYDKLLNTTNNAWNSEANFRSFWADSIDNPTLTIRTITVSNKEVPDTTNNTGKLSYTTMKGNFGAKYPFENTCQSKEFATGVV
jgi:hypothetical protein